MFEHLQSKNYYGGCRNERYENLMLNMIWQFFSFFYVPWVFLRCGNLDLDSRFLVLSTFESWLSAHLKRTLWPGLSLCLTAMCTSCYTKLLWMFTSTFTFHKLGSHQTSTSLSLPFTPFCTAHFVFPNAAVRRLNHAPVVIANSALLTYTACADAAARYQQNTVKTVRCSICS